MTGKRVYRTVAWGKPNCRSAAKYAAKRLLAEDWLAMLRVELYLLQELPDGTIVNSRSDWPINKSEAVLSEAERYIWLKKTLNDFVNVLRPRLKKWYQETRA
jgi:hypothetical protein